jgi:hypothetical protein
MEPSNRERLLAIASAMVAWDEDGLVEMYLTLDVLQAKGMDTEMGEFGRMYEEVHTKIRDLKARKPGVVVKILRDKLGKVEEITQQYDPRTPEAREGMRKVSEDVLEALREAGLEV